MTSLKRILRHLKTPTIRSLCRSQTVQQVKLLSALLPSLVALRVGDLLPSKDLVMSSVMSRAIAVLSVFLHVLYVLQQTPTPSPKPRTMDPYVPTLPLLGRTCHVKVKTLPAAVKSRLLNPSSPSACQTRPHATMQSNEHSCQKRPTLHSAPLRQHAASCPCGAARGRVVVLSRKWCRVSCSNNLSCVCNSQHHPASPESAAP